MCGILGSVNIYFDNSALDLIKHRGPDDSGIEEAEVDGNIIRFGQRRLSIVDLSPAGHQPMFTACGNYMIVFNGEIYNHLELRDKLPAEIKFKGHSDTETILYYLKHFGISGIKDFNGIFAIAFLDIMGKKLILARDPVGVKPLYYSKDENKGLVFSSEIRPVLKLGKNSDLDNEALASLLRLRYNASPDTLYKQIKKIKPGHYLEIDLKEENFDLKHFPFIGAMPKTIKPKGDLVPTYGQILEESVKRQLLSDVEIGILLSGGIDSAIVAALAERHYKGKLKAFTIGFEGNNSEDEIDAAAETAQILGLDHRFVRISFTDFLTIIKKCIQIVEEPLATTSTIPMYFLSELASKEVKVVLTGQGADEPLGGYTRYKSELIRHMVPAFLRKSLLPFVKNAKTGNGNLSRGMKAVMIDNDLDRFLTLWEVFGVEDIKNLISVTDKTSFNKISYWYNLLNCPAKEHPVERMMALDTRLNLADDLLNYTDKITMNFALECRVPMLDLQLLNFIESLPHDLKLNYRRGKIIHKRYASRILPASIINRKKKGFLSPTNSWFKDEAETIREILLKENTVFSELFNQKYVSEIIKLHQSGINREKQIFLLLNIYFWLETITENNKLI